MTDESQEEYVLTFKNGALSKLKGLAQKLNVSEDKLDEVISKGLKILELPEDDKIMFKRGTETYIVDIKKL